MLKVMSISVVKTQCTKYIFDDIGEKVIIVLTSIQEQSFCYVLFS